MIPFNISCLSGLECTKLPRSIVVSNEVHTLGGYFLHSTGHYTAVIQRKCITMDWDQQEKKTAKTKQTKFEF